MSKTFFRPAAIAAADRLDTLPTTMRVTGPVMRGLAAALAALLVGATVASSVVTVPLRVEGHGILSDGSGTLITPVLAPASSYVERLLVDIGTRVEPGQTVATLVLPDRQVEIEQAKRALVEAERTAEENARLREIEAEAQSRAFEGKQRALDERVAGAEQRLAWMERRVANLARLSEDGFATEQSLIEARIAREDAFAAVLDAEGQRASLDSERESAETERQRQALSDEMAVARARDRLNGLQEDYARDSLLTASASGVVTAVDGRPGTLVEAGAPVLEILDRQGGDDTNLEARVFVPLDDGKRLQPGNRVLIAPASLPAGSNSRLVGSVTAVSDTPASEALLKSILGESDLAQTAMAEGPPFVVTVALARDADAFLWTSPDPPPVTLSPGIPLAARLTAERRPLIALAVPALKRLFGIRPDPWSGGPA